MKNTSLIKVLTVAVLFTGVTCWTLRAADGQELWDKNCASCHGKDGKGQTKMGQKNGCKDYSDAKIQAALTDEKVLKAIKEGVTVDGAQKMKSFAERVSDDESKVLVAYLRTLKK